MEIFSKNKSFENYEYNANDTTNLKKKIDLYNSGIKPLGEANSDELNIVLKELTMVVSAIFDWVFPLNIEGKSVTLDSLETKYEGIKYSSEGIIGYTLSNLTEDSAKTFVTDFTESLKNNINRVLVDNIKNINTNKANISSNLSKITTLENTTIPNLKTGLENSINSNLSKITTLEKTTIPGLENKLTDLINTNKANISSNLSKITTLENTTIPNLKTGLENSINSNLSKITTLEKTTIPGLDGKINSNLSEINTLKNTTIPNLKTGLENSITGVENKLVNKTFVVLESFTDGVLKLNTYQYTKNS